MIPAVIREAQADACLEAASIYKEPLLALARRLAGSQEGGMDLYQQTLLNCHEAIQRNGFAGDRYQFYLRRAIINLHRKEQKMLKKHPTEELTEAVEAAASPAPASDGLAQLADQMMSEVKARFSDAERIELRLHLDGYSSREIAALTGRGEHTGIWRRLDKMKDYLRTTFQQAWDALEE